MVMRLVVGMQLKGGDQIQIPNFPVSRHVDPFAATLDSAFAARLHALFKYYVAPTFRSDNDRPPTYSSFSALKYLHGLADYADDDPNAVNEYKTIDTKVNQNALTHSTPYLLTAKGGLAVGAVTGYSNPLYSFSILDEDRCLNRSVSWEGGLVVVRNEDFMDYVEASDIKQLAPIAR